LTENDHVTSYTFGFRRRYGARGNRFCRRPSHACAAAGLCGVIESVATTGSLNSIVFPLSNQSSPNGAIGGAHIGYNWQFNQFVLGVEANVDATNYQGRTNLYATSFFPTSFFGPFSESGAARNDIRSTIQGSFRGRAGWAWNNWLFYGTGGVAFTDATTEYRGVGNFSPDIFGGTFDSRTREHVGWTAGGGIEWAFNNNWIFGVEYRYSDFGKWTDNGLFGTGITSSSSPIFGSGFTNAAATHHLTENQVQARVSYKFDWLAPVPVVAKY